MHRLVMKILSLFMLLLLDLAARSKGSTQVSSDVTRSKTDSSDNYDIEITFEDIVIIIIWLLVIIVWISVQIYLSSDLCSSLIRGFRIVKQRVYHFFHLLFGCAVEHRENRQLRRRRSDSLERQREYTSSNPNQGLTWEDSPV